MTGVIQRLLWAALLAGAVAGLVLAGIQQFTVTPMILEAETYETAGPGEVAPAEAGHDQAGHGHGDGEAWGPHDGFERTFYTFLTSILAGVGFGLILTACYALVGGVDWRRGILWGLGGFAAVNLAPALGLPPELPGAAAAELGGRQLWWVLTVVLTAGGLAMIAFLPRAYLKGLGVVLIVLPHVIGAPQPEAHGGLAPAELEHAFIYVSLIANAVFWVVLGVLSGFLFDRFRGGAATG